jgi:hypothetical protein
VEDMDNERYINDDIRGVCVGKANSNIDEEKMKKRINIILRMALGRSR